jgi:hypothetical protein
MYLMMIRSLLNKDISIGEETISYLIFINITFQYMITN